MHKHTHTHNTPRGKAHPRSQNLRDVGRGRLGESARKRWSEALIEGAEATDAFSQEWRGELVWAHPPPGLLLHVAQFLEETGAAARVCAPFWPGAAWYAMLLDLSDEHVLLPPGTLQHVAADAAPRLGSWPVVVFRVPGGRQAAAVCAEGAIAPNPLPAAPVRSCSLQPCGTRAASRRARDDARMCAPQALDGGGALLCA